MLLKKIEIAERRYIVAMAIYSCYGNNPLLLNHSRRKPTNYVHYIPLLKVQNSNGDLKKHITTKCPSLCQVKGYPIPLCKLT